MKYFDREPIPEIFHSDAVGGPFTLCGHCGLELLVPGVRYLVQKRFDGETLVSESALCLACQRQRFGRGLTRRSSRGMKQHLWNHVDFKARSRYLLGRRDHRLELWIDRCLLCSLLRNQARSAAVLAQCQGTDLLYHYFPGMFCGGCEKALAGTLDRKAARPVRRRKAWWRPGWVRRPA
ncbi:MAG: hypothetical protein OER86_02470 [Phycisphaerae bacterium]|nr:hypothetical protein [Phycisphaerae bacterium]